MKNRICRFFIGCLWCFLTIGFNGNVFCQENEKKIEKQQFLFMVEQAYLQEQGEWQVSFSTQYLDEKKSREIEYENEERYDTLKIKNEWQWVAAIEYGIYDWMQLEVEIPFVNVRRKTVLDADGVTTSSYLDKTGIADVEAGLMFKLSKEDPDKWWATSISLGLGGAFPTGNWKKDLGTDRYGWETQLSLSKVIDKFVAHLNGGMGMVNNAKEQGESGKKDVKEIKCGVALAYRPTDKFDLISEVFAEFEDAKATGNKDYETQAYFTPGIRYKLFDGCEIGAGVPIGLTYESHKWGITTKVLYEW